MAALQTPKHVYTNHKISATKNQATYSYVYTNNKTEPRF